MDSIEKNQIMATNRMHSLLDNAGFIHKIAVLGKDYYTINTIIDLFIFAGADLNWLEDEEGEEERYTSSRMQTVYEWVESVRKNAAGHEADVILRSVAVQMAENDYINEADKNYLLRAIGDFETPVNSSKVHTVNTAIPEGVEELLTVLIKGLPKAMYPLKHDRREGLPRIEFNNEYDVQSLFHALLRPWIKDVRPEEFTPSYAGSSTRIDFLLPEYGIVCEVKYIRDERHSRKVGDELIIDIAHYRVHPQCETLYIVIYDPMRLIKNPDGLGADLSKQSESMKVKTFVLGS